jgi:soluble lytic murein transglycosylase-like protein
MAKGLALTVLAVLLAHSVPFSLPRAALPYKIDLIRQAHSVFGPDAPIALLAAQIERESYWDKGARSPSGDLGIAQIKPSTARYLAHIRPGPGPGSPRDPVWSLSAMAWYDYHLRDAIKDAADDCQRWKFALAAYNGGLGWVNRERTSCKRSGHCDSTRWDGNVERFKARSIRAWRENRQYVTRVIATQSRYQSWGPLACSLL